MDCNDLHEPPDSERTTVGFHFADSYPGVPSWPFIPVDLDRCTAVRHGERCLRRALHTGQHIATVGPFQRWDRQRTNEELGERSASALLWQSWARELGLDAEQMRQRLLDICKRTGLPASDLLFALFEV